MATNPAKDRKDIYSEPIVGLMNLTIATNRIASNEPGVNSYEIRNAIVNAEKKERIRYENGVTALPYSVQMLFEDAERKANHRRTLARNIVHATGQARVAKVSAHHIVASVDSRAEDSRTVLFGCGIGINDADNGVFLPTYKSSVVPSMPDASPHGPIHTARYHGAVYARLRLAKASDTPEVRKRLKKMKADMVAGVFPF